MSKSKAGVCRGLAWILCAQCEAPEQEERLITACANCTVKTPPAHSPWLPTGPRAGSGGWQSSAPRRCGHLGDRCWALGGEGKGAPAAQTERGWGALVPHCRCHSRWERSANNLMLCRGRFGCDQPGWGDGHGPEQLLLSPAAGAPFPRAGIPVARRGSQDRDTCEQQI